MVTRDEVVEKLKEIEDPELFLDIWFLGLIYHIGIEESGAVNIEMTFTSPMCPVGPQLVQQVRDKVGSIDGVTDVEVTVVFLPPWQPSDEVKEMLGIE